MSEGHDSSDNEGEIRTGGSLRTTFRAMDAEHAYTIAKNAKKGQTIKCPICGKSFEKKHYQQAFCCDRHKVKYWNLVRS